MQDYVIKNINDSIKGLLRSVEKSETLIENLEKRLDGMERLHDQYRTAVKEATRPYPFRVWFDDYVIEKPIFPITNTGDSAKKLIREHCARAWTAAEDFYIVLGEMWYGRTIEEHRKMKRPQQSVWKRLAPDLFPDNSPPEESF